MGLARGSEISQSQLSDLERQTGVFVLPKDPSTWWRKDDLFRVARHGPAADDLIAGVEDGTVQTPPDLIDLRDGRAPQTGNIVADIQQLLEAQPGLARLGVAVRLQDFRSSSVKEPEFAAVLDGESPDELDPHGSLVTAYSNDGERHWRFNHPTSREAVDAWMIERADRLTDFVGHLKVGPMWLHRSLETWRRAQGLAGGGSAFVVAQIEPSDWFAARLGMFADDDLLDEVIGQTPDAWGAIELTYELVRVWRTIRRHPRATELLERISEWPLGDYALLEACLYLGEGTHPELWACASARLYEMSRDADRWFESLLVLDAIMWRPPNQDAIRAYARRALAEVDPDSSAFAVIRFGLGYHPDGLDFLQPGRLLDIDARRGLTSGQALCAARLVAFHYAHQSRARAMLHRSGHVDKDWLCQTLHEQAAGPIPPGAVRLIESLSDFEQTSGWAFHLACNLAAITPLDLREGPAGAATRAALGNAPTGDQGIVSAVLAYDTADSMSSLLRKRFSGDADRHALMDALARGVDALGYRVGPPRFHYIFDPDRVLRVSGVSTGKLDPELPRSAGDLAAGLWSVYAKVAGDNSDRQRSGLEIIGRVERGDIRPLELAARGGVGSAFEEALDSAISFDLRPELF